MGKSFVLAICHRLTPPNGNMTIRIQYLIHEGKPVQRENVTGKVSARFRGQFYIHRLTFEL